MAWYDNPALTVGTLGLNEAVQGRNPIKAVTNTLGITSPAPPDLSKGPDAQALRDFAKQRQQELAAYNPQAAPVLQPGIENVGEQRTAMGLDRSAAEGGQPSAAQALFQKGIDQAAAGQLGAAGAFQGSRPGLAIRSGLEGMARTMAGSAGDMAALRANEMATARGQYGQLASGARGQDIDIAGQNAANELAGRSESDRYKLGLGGLTETSLLAPYNAALANQQIQLQNQAANQTALGSIYGAGATALAKSDETSKKDIHGAASDADAFLKGLDPKTYSYKDTSEPGATPGKHLGVLAQNMTDGVTVGPDGKRWISADVISNVLAGMGRLHERVSNIEGKREHD